MLIMNKKIGDKLKKLRYERSFSQEQVADYLNISQSSYARMENGETHTWPIHLEKICKIFEITPEEFIINDEVVIGNIGTNNGVGYAAIVNQLLEKLIEQYETRIKEKDEIIASLKKDIKL